MRVLRLAALVAVAVAFILADRSVSGSLEAKLAAARRAKGAGYVPRTHHLRPDGTPVYTNRLILEASPYLLQHAHNPVDWYPWGDEAFAKARREGRPVLLSVGYSTCHWCHVMERESFEDEGIADYLNRHYVAIKVDREERPDVDAVYMEAVRQMSQRGGWPMTVWLTPDRQPFYGGTYFPARAGDRGARTGFLELLMQLRTAFDEDPEKVAQAASDVIERVERSMTPTPSTVPTADAIRAAVDGSKRSFDARLGGFGRAPKFPRSVRLEMLLRYHRRTGDAAALDMVVRTLDAMASGGIYDHVGGGFHRYSTDARWLVPHFEKMLYDNALLVVSYLEAFQVTGEQRFADVARDVLTYVGRDMTDPTGAFWAATDADSEGEEGTFFVWTPDEIRAVLGDDAPLVLRHYAVTDAGNFEGRNILHTPQPLVVAARAEKLTLDDARTRLAHARERLRTARATRIPPLTDRKVIGSWNGLMISAFARAGRILNDPKLTATATRAMDAVLGLLGTGDRLKRHAIGGRATGSGFLSDYAFLIAALLDCWEATFDVRWLDRAIALQRTLDDGFLDEHGGYYRTATWHEALLTREKPDYDGAEPAGNSVALQNLVRLHALTTNDTYRERADGLLRGLGNTITRMPGAVPRLLAALDFHLDRAKEIIIVTPHSIGEARRFLDVLRNTYHPSHVLAVVPVGTQQAALAKRLPPVAGKILTKGRATAYVCERWVCDLPTADAATFAKQIAGVAPL